MAATLIGTLRPRAKGVHVQANAYNIMDVVTGADGSKAYMAVKDVPAGTALADTEYWCIYTDLSAVKSAMEQATTNADNALNGLELRVDDMVSSAAKAISNLTDYTSEYALRVRGEIGKSAGNPLVLEPDEGSLLQPVTEFTPKQEGSGDPYPYGATKNLLDYDKWKNANVANGTAVWRDYGVVLTANAPDCHTSWNNDNAYKLYVTAGETITVSWEYVGNEGLVYIFPNGSADGCVHTWGTDCSLSYTVPDGVEYITFRVGVTTAGETAIYKNIQIEKSSVATDFVPPSNIRPISGYDSLNLTRCGKNLLPNTATTQTINGVTFTVDSDGTVTANGTATDTIIFYTATDVPVAAGSYVLNGGPAGGSINTYSLRLMTPDGLIYDDIGNGRAFECAGENINAMIVVRPGYTASNLTFYPMIRLATETDADYVPYQGDAYTVRIGQTVCGGRMNWLTGEMLVEYDCVVLDGVKNTLSAVNGWNNQLYGFELGKAGYKRPMPLGGGVCSHFPVLNDRAGTTACHPSSDGVGRLYIGVLPGVSNADEYNARLQADPITCAYRIDEPYAIQLTPHQILALQGANTLLGDGDSIEVEWVKPLQTSIEERTKPLIERIAALEAAILNS